MVQSYQSPVRVYKYPFELVMAVSRLISLGIACSCQICNLICFVSLRPRFSMFVLCIVHDVYPKPQSIRIVWHYMTLFVVWAVE